MDPTLLVCFFSPLPGQAFRNAVEWPVPWLSFSLQLLGIESLCGEEH